jgi:cysteine desulfurase
LNTFNTLGCSNEDVIATNYYLDKYPKQQLVAITSSFEHPSVLKVFKHYDDNQYVKVMYVDPCNNINDSEYGCIKASDINKAIHSTNDKIILISIMHGNNETGAIQDIKGIGQLANKYNIFFHSDITQSLGKYIIHPKEYYLDAVSFSGHKFHGPKGIGGLYINKSHNDLLNLCYGGEQEHQRRPGTENVSNIVGLTLALQKVHTNRNNKSKSVLSLKKWLINKISQYEDITVLGSNINRSLPNTILLMINNLGSCNRVLVKELNKRKIYVSVGSACQTTSGSSHVLDVLKLTKKDKLKVIRISLSDYTTLSECKYFVNNLLDILKLMRRKN